MSAAATATPAPKRTRKTVGQVSGAAARRMPVPILMYHVISAAALGLANAELWVDQHVFADEMRALRAAKYTAVTLEQVWNAWEHGGPLPKHPVVSPSTTATSRTTRTPGRCCARSAGRASSNPCELKRSGRVG